MRKKIAFKMSYIISELLSTPAKIISLNLFFRSQLKSSRSLPDMVDEQDNSSSGVSSDQVSVLRLNEFISASNMH